MQPYRSPEIAIGDVDDEVRTIEEEYPPEIVPEPPESPMVDDLIGRIYLTYSDKGDQEDSEMHFSSIYAHHGPLKNTDPVYNANPVMQKVK